MSPSHAFKSRAVLVTGATGFIGGHLCHELAASGAAVHALCRPGAMISAEGIRSWTCALDDRPRLKAVLQDVRPECVFHLAGFSRATRDRDAVGPSLHSNLVATVNLLEAVTDAGCGRIVLAGSLEEPGPGEEPSSPYAASKWASSAYAMMFHRLYGTPVGIARIYMTYGPGQRDTRKLIPYTILSLLRGIAPRISSGTRMVDWVSVRDVVTGFISLGDNPRAVGQTVDLGTGILISVRETVELICRILGTDIAPVFGAVADRESEQVRRADPDRTAALLNWRPAIPLETGLVETIQHYRDNAEFIPHDSVA